MKLSRCYWRPEAATYSRCEVCGKLRTSKVSHARCAKIRQARFRLANP